MPDLSDQELRQLADLARLDLQPEELPSLRTELGKLLDYVDRLADFDDPELIPLRHPNLEGGASGMEVLRQDSVRPGLGPDELDLLPRLDDRVRVPRTVDRDG